MILEPSKQTKLYAHEKELCNLINLHTKKLLPNKILFSGEKGIGKSTLSYHLINYVLSYDQDNPYDLKNFKINHENKSFKLTQNKSNPNFILVDVNEEKKNIDINQIRNLISSLNKSSFNSKPRFVLIDNIELLNLNSVNALLKILEEPNDNIYFILINNNKKILPTLRSRCLNFKITLSFEQSIYITNKLLNNDIANYLDKRFLTHYSTPGILLTMVHFASNNEIDLTNINLKNLISKTISDKKYKKDTSIKELIYSLIELYFRNNISINNIRLMKMYSYFLKKINTTKIFNLDDDSLFMEFEEKVLNE